MNKRTEEQIAKIEAKIKKLQDVYSDDIGESYREATQTQELIDQYKIKLNNLRESTSQQGNSKIFELKDESRQVRIITVSESAPDPSKGVISNKSDIGQKLLKSKVGHSIKIGKNAYKLTSILSF